MKKIIYIAIAMFVCASCSDYLDTLPKGLIVAKTASDFRLLLDNADTRYTNNLSQTSVYVDVVSDDSEVDTSTYNQWKERRLHVKNLYSFEDEVWLPDGATTDVVWKNAYYISTLISNILDEIYRAEEDKALQQQLIAEAKVHRAYAYLTLVNIYAKHYNPQTASSDLGVPIISNPVELPSLERASVQKVYDFITSELLASIESLPEDVAPQFIHRPTQVSAYAILARTYLYMGNYEKALEYSNKSLEIRNFLYDYNEIYTGEPTPDNLIGLSRTSDQEMLLHKTTNSGFHLKEYMWLDSTTFNELYDGYQIISPNETENYDLRRSLWFDGVSSAGPRGFVRYTFSDANHRYSVDNDGDVDYIPVATPEMYLTRAEANARLGNLQEALNDVNTIRNHRYVTGTYTDVTVADLGGGQQAVIDEVLLERRRELYAKELRLFDVKRLGLPVTHTLGAEDITLPPNDPKMVWPIYYEYLILNPEIEQNPR